MEDEPRAVEDLTAAAPPEAAVQDDDGAASDRLPGSWLLNLPYVPLAFLGLGVYRAWIELVFVGSFVAFPFQVSAAHDVFDAAMIAVLFACAACARRIGPFHRRRSVYATCALCMTAGTVLAFAALFRPEAAGMLAPPATLLGGVGVALVILLWSELYSCLEPYRVGLYYCASIVCAALLLYLCRGLAAPWLAVVAALLPVLSLVLASLGFMGLPAADRPREISARFSFPWKPALLMAIYAFAYGLRETSQYATGFGPHSALGTLAIGAVMFVVIWREGRSFDFSVLYRVALPLMVGAFLILPAFGGVSTWLADFCAMASYTTFSILIMLILANMSYRYGMSAVWLFGIERGVRALFTLAGRGAAVLIGALGPGVDGSLVVGSLTVLLVVVGTMVFVSERDFNSRWGVSFKGGDIVDERAHLREEDRDARCRDLAARYGLSARETQVLCLLARGRTAAQVRDELVVSKDTVKTHMKHIYRKMGVHSREELLDLVGE